MATTMIYPRTWIHSPWKHEEVLAEVTAMYMKAPREAAPNDYDDDPAVATVL